MFSGAVETDVGEILNIRYRDGMIGGNPLLVFWTSLSNYCHGDESVDLAWIKRLESHGQERLCSFCQGFLNCFVEGDWAYGEDYDLHLRISPEHTLSREAFDINVSRRKNAWVSTQDFITVVSYLLKLAKSDVPDPSDWHNAEALVLDLEALHETLLIFMSREAHQVRVLIF